MSSTLQDKSSDVKLQLMYRISSTIWQLQSEMCDVDWSIEDNFCKISKSVLQNIAGEVDLFQSQCDSLNKAMDDLQKNLSCDGKWILLSTFKYMYADWTVKPYFSIYLYLCNKNFMLSHYISVFILQVLISI